MSIDAALIFFYFSPWIGSSGNPGNSHCQYDVCIAVRIYRMSKKSRLNQCINSFISPKHSFGSDLAGSGPNCWSGSELKNPNLGYFKFLLIFASYFYCQYCGFYSRFNHSVCTTEVHNYVIRKNCIYYFYSWFHDLYEWKTVMHITYIRW